VLPQGPGGGGDSVQGVIEQGEPSPIEVGYQKDSFNTVWRYGIAEGLPMIISVLLVSLFLYEAKHGLKIIQIIKIHVHSRESSDSYG